MNTHKPLIAWVNCYGAWAPDLRLPVETIGYDQYLTALVSCLIPVKDRLQSVHLAGGMRDAAGRTECETTGPELQRRLRLAGIEVPMEYDEAPITSMTIARGFVQALQADPGKNMLLFVDEVRYASNCWVVEELARQAGADIAPARQLVVPVPRLDCHPHSTSEFQEAKLEEMRRLGIAEIERREVEKRAATGQP